MIIHTILLMVFLALLIREDMVRFEIEFAALAMVALNGAALNIHLGQSPLEMALGAGIWALAALAVRSLMGRNRLGQGDIWLFAGIGLIAGASGALSAVVLFVILSLATSYAYARARGRKMARSLYPAAIPGVLTILLILMARLVWMQMPDPDATGTLRPPSGGIITGIALTHGPWIAVALALCAGALMAKDRKSRETQIRGRRAQHG